jgi:hypothetical protein
LAKDNLMADTTSRGYVFPENTDHTRLWEHIENLAESIDDDITALTAAYGSYTPVWSSTGTQPSVGTGATVDGKYLQVGSRVYVRARIILGSSPSAGSGVYRFSLPVTPKLDSILPFTFFDQSASAGYTCVCRITSAATTGDNMRIYVAGQASSLGAAVPAAPAAGDVFILSGVYEAN